MGADGGGAAFEWGACAPCGGVYTASGLSVAAACAGGRTIYRVDVERSGGTATGARDHQRSAAGVCAGERAGPMGGRDGKVRAGGIRSGVSNALHHEWGGGER